MFVIIMGCGRVGARVASAMSRGGHEVLILDVNASAFDRLDADFGGTTVVGNGIDMDVLRRIGIERADAFLACTQGDNRNIMASQIAQHIFNVSKVVTRIYDPLRQDTFKALGLEAISSTVIAADRFIEVLDPDLVQEGLAVDRA
ncbi:MAG: TrkA family potassium uptake protein [Chloroflexi bacterium]|nr:TrkA family potassium uptake protein [Chloroflexota bacterium]